MKLVAVTAELWPWVRDHMNRPWTEDTRGLAMLDSSGNVAACALADTWTKASCHTHIIVVNPLALRHGFMDACYDYVFNFSKLSFTTGVVASTNLGILNFLRRHGWVEVWSD